MEVGLDTERTEADQPEEDAPPSSKAERLEVARSALSNAEKCRNWRAKKKAEDPDYLSREALRQRNRRKG